MKIKLFLILLLNSMFALSQSNTLSVTDLTGNHVYYEYHFSATGAFISDNGIGAPLNTPLKIKLTSGPSTTTPTFVAGDLHGNCDSYQSGSMNNANTEFITTLSSCCSSSSQVRLANNLIFLIPIKCTPSGGTGSSCVTYNISSTHCDLYCITFLVAPHAPAICKGKTHSVIVNFQDGTSTTINVKFSTNNNVFCSPKPISGIPSTSFSSCDCIDNIIGTLQKQTNGLEKSKEQFIVSPNPTNSNINFHGDNLDESNVSIFDLDGNIIINNKSLNTKITLDGNKKGIYLYIIENKNGTTQKGKIIKE